MKLGRLINVCLTEIFSRVRADKHLSDMFRIKNSLNRGDPLSPLHANFALAYAIRSVQETHDGLKINGTNQLLFYADDVNMLGGSVHAIKENAESLVVASKEIGLEINADMTKYMVMSRDLEAG